MYSNSHLIFVAGFFKADFKDKEMHTEYAINIAKRNRQLPPLLFDASKIEFKPNTSKMSVPNSQKTHG